MRTVWKTIAALLGSLTVLLGTAPAASAVVAFEMSISLNRHEGYPGDSFTITWSSTYYCKSVYYTFGGAASNRFPAFGYSGTMTGTVPNNAPALYDVYGFCDSGDYRSNAQEFQVLRRQTTTNPPTSSTRPPTTSAQPPTTNPPVTPPVTPPGQPPVTRPPRNPPSTTSRRPSRPPVTNPPGTTPPGTTVPPPIQTELPPLSTSDPRPTSDGDLTLDRLTVGPGEALSASGKGCKPGAPVTLMSKGERVGGAVADSSGSFSAPVQFTRLEPGRHWITTNCGVALTAAVDQVVTSSSGGQNRTLVILVFFVLVGVSVIRFR